MHKLVRQVRLTFNPAFSQEIEVRTFPHSGLSIFLELGVELTGTVEPSTGFIVNVTTIDKMVHQHITPLFTDRISKNFQQGRNTDVFEAINLLKSAWESLSDKFDNARLSKLTLSLNPFRKISIDCEDKQMVYFSEKFEFAAAHKLWNDSFSEQRNFETFGKCASPSGHGHNYTIEVAVKIPDNRMDFNLGLFYKIVEDNFIKLVDHKNLNIDVPHFTRILPTVENIAAFAWQNLAGKFGEAKLHCVTIWETDRTYCSYYG